jgi:hypothetical protein
MRLIFLEVKEAPSLADQIAVVIFGLATLVLSSRFTRLPTSRDKREGSEKEKER